MPEHLKPHVLEHLLQSFESGTPRRRISELRFYYPGAASQDILASGAYLPRGADPERLIKTDAGEDGHDGYRTVWEERDEKSGKRKYFYLVPGLKPIEVNGDDLRIYDFRRDWLPEWLAQQIGDHKPEELLENWVWRLGHYRGTAIILVRGLSHAPYYETIYETLEEQVKMNALILSRSPLYSPRLPLPEGHQVVLFQELFRDTTHVCLDPWIKGCELDWNPDTGILRWGDLPPLKGKGRRRKDLFNHLYEAGHDFMEPRQNIHELFKKCGLSCSMTIEQYFKGPQTHWTEYIGFDDTPDVPFEEKRCWLRYFVDPS